MTNELLADVYEALDLEAVQTHVGALKINRKKGKDNVQVRQDEWRLFGIAIRALLNLDTDATLDFLAALHKNGEFPQQELLEALSVETQKPENILTIEYSGAGTFYGDKLYRIKRSELV